MWPHRRKLLVPWNEVNINCGSGSGRATNALSRHSRPAGQYLTEFGVLESWSWYVPLLAINHVLPVDRGKGRIPNNNYLKLSAAGNGVEDPLWSHETLRLAGLSSATTLTTMQPHELSGNAKFYCRRNAQEQTKANGGTGKKIRI